MNPTTRFLLAVVVIGKAGAPDAVLARHCVPLQVSACAEPSDFTLIISFWPSTGVPEGLLIVVTATLNAPASSKTSVVSLLGAHVVAFAAVELSTRGLIR